MSVLKPEDLQFLIDKEAVLRFQSPSHQKEFLEEGKIQGDAYSLSDPKYWNPPDETKVETFERELKQIILTSFTGFARKSGYEGSFLLLKDVGERAHNPASWKDYKPPFTPIGPGHIFLTDQCMGQVDITHDLVFNQLGFYDNRPNKEAVEKTVDYIANSIFSEIIRARTEEKEGKTKENQAYKNSTASILTPEDLQFLVHKKIALRFHPPENQKRFEKEGEIIGDAYSIGDPDYWLPPNAIKAAKFEQNFKGLIRRVFKEFGSAAGTCDGSFLLLGDVEGARKPVSYARHPELYKAPFLTVGSPTHYSADQCLGKVDVPRALIGNRLDQNQLWESDQKQEREALENKAIDHIADELLSNIVRLRKNFKDQWHEAEKDTTELLRRRESARMLDELRAQRRAQRPGGEGGLPGFRPTNF